MFFRSSATPANPFDASSSSSSSPPRTATTATSIGNTSDSSLPTSSATTASLFTTPSRSSYYPSSSSAGRALPPPPSSSTNNESPFYQQQQHHQHHPNNSSAGARTASNLADRSSRKNNVHHSYLTPSKAYHPSNSPFDLPSHTHTHATNSNSSKTPPPSSMATRFQQHQQSLMQKFQHYPSSGNQASNVTSSPQGAGPGPPHPHHNAFSPYGGPPGSPAGYPGFGLHSGPPGPPPGAVGSGPGHLQGGPSPGIHHSGNAGAGNGSGSFGPPSQSQGSGSRYGAPHIGGGGGGSGQNGPHSQMNGHHPHSQAHFHGQHMGGSNGPPGNQQAQIGMGSGSDERSGINGQGQQQQQQQTDFKNSSSAHAQQQMEYAEVSRQSTSPHHHARAAHLQQRGMTASGNVAVGDPLRHPTMSIGRPNKDSKDKEHGRSDSLAADDIRPLTVTAIRKGANTARSTDTPPTINTAAYIEAEREKTGQAWSTIDMGGMHLRNLSAELFRYSFLTTLYVPHNNLTSLPPALSSLTHLVLLDVSGNKLSSVPPELGMLTNLRELLLFDNQLTNLPAELGTLYQLDLLGIEGNPLPDNLRQLVDKEGTQGLISYLRDSCPVPLPPADREWISVDADSFPSAADADLPEPETFSVFCYNVLCEKAATPQMYGYTPSWALSWDYRKELILQEILGYSADIICLQEVDGQQYEEFFLPNLSNNGYEGIYWPRTKARTMTAEEKKHVDGNATFYKPSTFSLVEQQLVEFNQIAMRRPDFKKTEDMFNRVMTKDNIAVIALLEHKESGARLICANTHIYWDNEFRDVKLVQVAMLMDELTKIANHFARLPPKHPSALGKGYDKAPAYSEGNKIPMVICGDFNSQKSSGVYEYLTNGTVDKNHDDFMHHVYGSYTSEGLAHRFALKSAYSHLDNNGGAGSVADGPIITNWTPTFKGCIDHIWHTTNSLGVTGLLGEVDPAYLSKVVGFPNAHFPSDHISILAEFKVKPQHSGNERQPEKAQFRLGGLGR